MKHYFLTLILLIGLTTITFGQDTSLTKSKEIRSSSKIDSLNVSVNLNDIEQIEHLLKKKDPSWFTTYGTMIVALVALFGAVLTSILNNRRSKLNTQQQLNANRENITSQLTASQINLTAQIQANSIQEIEKKKLELEFKLKNELKENVAKFINKATILNGKLNYIIYSELEEGRIVEANEEYSKTYPLRQEIKDLFYSIKVTLDGSEKQRQLEEVLNNYMKVTCFEFDLEKTKSEQYEQPIGQLYHKIKSIIHNNYTEPI
jgi:hypothetical protein